ncbi:MAG: hypothetical protein V1707_00150 [bacterium]
MCNRDITADVMTLEDVRFDYLVKEVRQEILKSYYDKKLPSVRKQLEDL